MKERFKLAIALLAGLAFAAAALLLLIFFWGRYYPLPYSSLPPVIQPAGTPADLGELTARVKNIEDNQVYNMKVFEWKLDQKLLILSWVALLISLGAGVVGIKTYNDLEKLINEEVRRALDKALYHLDPTNLRIWIVSYEKEVTFRGDRVLDEKGKPKFDENRNPVFEPIKSDVADEMKAVYSRIELTGLLNTNYLRHPDQHCFDGVTVIPVFDPEMEEAFRSFLDRNQVNLDPQRAAFVLYTRDHLVSQTKTLAKYANLATANMLPTVSSMILTVGRGLSNAMPSTLKENSK
jgi:hypothetical protein